MISKTTSNGQLTVWVEGVGLLGPGLVSWPVAASIFQGTAAHVWQPTVLPAPARLPAAERRRAGAAVKLAMAIADEAVAHAQINPHTLASVFSASSGEGLNCHLLCETLASPSPLVSPTRFTNSVHNAAAGCWHIAVASRAASTSLGAFDASFSAGLLEGAASVATSGAPLLLVASDTPYPEPLHATRPLPDAFGVALVLSPVATPHSLAVLHLALLPGPHVPTRCADESLERLRSGVPAAHGLPLLHALANSSLPTQTVLLGHGPQLSLQATVQRCLPT
jgi:hypothetical protein